MGGLGVAVAADGVGESVAAGVVDAAAPQAATRPTVNANTVMDRTMVRIMSLQSYGDGGSPGMIVPRSRSESDPSTNRWLR